METKDCGEGRKVGSEVSIIKGKDIRENVTRAIELIGGIKDIIKLTL